jgi:hypothetical protein
MKLPGLPWATLLAGGYILAGVLVGVFLDVRLGYCGIFLALLCAALGVHLLLKRPGDGH